MGGPPKSRRPPRRLSRDELDLFAKVVRDTAPLRPESLDPPGPVPKVVPKPVPKPAPAVAAPSTPGVAKPTGPSALADHRHGGAPGVDRRLQLRLKRGQLPIEARIDLHGMTREKAHVALNGFLARQQALGRRCVLVITGKGRPDWERQAWGSEGRDSGVIRRALAGWLRDYPNKERVLAFAPAQPQDGGHGAWYVLLRRRRAS